MTRADAIVPKIAQIMEGEIGPGISAAKPGVIINDNLGHARRRFDNLRLLFARGASVIAERAKIPFRVDDSAVIRRQFGFRY